MSGRKSIMVDTPTWEKIDGYKHDLHLRNIGDAIGDAIDIVTSDEYYAGIYVDKDEDGKIKNYIVEALGRTEEEAIRNLLLFEQGSLYGDVHAEDIPPYSEFNGKKDRFFVIQCERKLYYDILRLTDVNNGKSKMDNQSHIFLYSCNIDYPNIEDLSCPEEYYSLSAEDMAACHRFPNQPCVLINPLNEEIIAVGASDVEVQRYFENSITNGELIYNKSGLEIAIVPLTRIEYVEACKNLGNDLNQALGCWCLETSRVRGCFAHIKKLDIDQSYGFDYGLDIVIPHAIGIERSHYAVISITFSNEAGREVAELISGKFSEAKMLYHLLNERPDFIVSISLIGCGESLTNAALSIPSISYLSWIYDQMDYIRFGFINPDKANLDETDRSHIRKNEDLKTAYVVMRCTKQVYDQFDEIKYSDLTINYGETLYFRDGEDLIADVATSKDETNPDATRVEPKQDAEKIDEEKIDEEKPGEEKND